MSVKILSMTVTNLVPTTTILHRAQDSEKLTCMLSWAAKEDRIKLSFSLDEMTLDRCIDTTPVNEHRKRQIFTKKVLKVGTKKTSQWVMLKGVKFVPRAD